MQEENRPGMQKNIEVVEANMIPKEEKIIFKEAKDKKFNESNHKSRTAI